ncbi:unnamed protein product [Prorocentrum cordatum]|uniref:Uncharacterized protein n=1 Tax=Prorocentrum cordatum TaxID=2364126 RepID=A0ABN9UZU6_9DINO|nr:unnamed protein product [Polarella glacialis]
MLPVGPLHKFLAVPISWACIHVWGQLFDYVREKVCVLDDGEKDFFEELWDDMAEETEDDVIGLTASFLTAQTLRYSITGNMPNAEGDEAPALVEGYSNWNVSCLIGWGFAMVIIEGVRLALIKKTFKRFTPQLQNVMAMNMAWSLFFGFGWFMGVNFPSLQGMLKHVVVALGLTFSSMLMIFVLDSVEIALKASHKKQVSKTADTSDNKRAKNIASFIESIVVALAILIGFSWEKAFDVAVEGVAKASEQRVPEHATKLLMGVVLAGVVVPAWRLHILPHIEKMNEELEEEEEEEEEEAEEEEKQEKEEAEKPGREGAAERRRSSREARGPPALEQAAGAARPRGGDELRRPLLGGGGRSPGRDAAGHEARMAELAGLKAEVDGKLDAVIAQLGVLDRRSAELVAGRRRIGEKNFTFAPDLAAPMAEQFERSISLQECEFPASGSQQNSELQLSEDVCALLAIMARDEGIPTAGWVEDSHGGAVAVLTEAENINMARSAGGRLPMPSAVPLPRGAPGRHAAKGPKNEMGKEMGGAKGLAADEERRVGAMMVAAGPGLAKVTIVAEPLRCPTGALFAELSQQLPRLGEARAAAAGRAQPQLTSKWWALQLEGRAPAPVCLQAYGRQYAALLARHCGEHQREHQRCIKSKKLDPLNMSAWYPACGEPFELQGACAGGLLAELDRRCKSPLDKAAQALQAAGGNAGDPSVKVPLEAIGRCIEQVGAAKDVSVKYDPAAARQRFTATSRLMLR